MEQNRPYSRALFYLRPSMDSYLLNLTSMVLIVCSSG